MDESQQRVRAFLRDSPVIGFLFLYAFSFLVSSVLLDIWELFDPGKSQLNRLPFKYLLPVGYMFPFWRFARRFEKKGSLEV